MIDKVALIQEVDVFASLDQEASEHLAHNTGLVQYKEGAHIIKKGELGDTMYIIAEGKVQIPIFDRLGQRRFYAQLGPAQIFGEVALITERPRAADVFALSDCLMLVINKPTLEGVMRQHPEVARLLTNILGKRLLDANAIEQVGKYKLLSELGRGGMSIVYEGFHPDLRRSVAVKMLSHELIYHPEFVERFRNEARIIAKLHHPNIVEVYDLEEAYATIFIVMEKIEGNTLRSVLSSKGRFTYDECRHILVELTKALEFAHSNGIIHRDINPMNIKYDAERHVKLMDFGLAMEPQSSSMEGALGAWGTYQYMSPEQILSKPFDGRADIYALGILAYELLVGEAPFDGDVAQTLQKHIKSPMPSLQQVLPDAPEDLSFFIEKATAKAPVQRFRNCTEVLALLDPPEPIPSQELPAYDMINAMAFRQLTFVTPANSAQVLDELVNKCQEWLRDHPEVQMLEASPTRKR